MRLRPLLLAFIVLLGGCPRSGAPALTVAPVLPAEYDPVAPCLVDGLQAIATVLATTSEVFLAIQDPSLSTIATPGASPTEWLFDAGALTGMATFSADPSGGMSMGDSVVVLWDYAEGDVSGDGIFTIRLDTPTQATLHGIGDLSRQVGCAFDIDITEAEPLTIDLTQFRSLAQAASGPGLAGPITIAVTFGGGNFSAIVVLGTTGITLTNVMLNGLPLAPVTIPWSAISVGSPPPPPPPPPGSGVTANWDGTWYLFYRCVLFGNPLFDGLATVQIAHEPGATTLTATETEGADAFDLTPDQPLSGNTAVVSSTYLFAGTQEVVETSTWTWFAAGKGLDNAGNPVDIPGAPERFCKISRAVLKSDPTVVVFVCFGTALRDSSPAVDPLTLICGTWK